MRKEVIAPLAVLILSAYSNPGYADLNDFLNKAKEKATETRDKANERIQETREKTREKLEETRDRARENIQRGVERGSEQLREQGRNLEERANEEYAIRKGNAQQFYQERLEPVVQEESRKFYNDPQGYTEDLANRVKQGRLKFEDVASSGVAQGFVDIKCRNGKRLGSIIEEELGIKEDYTKTGVKITVLYLMNRNPAFITKIPMIEDSQGRKYSIDDAQSMGIGVLESKAKELQGINTRLAYFYQQGRIQEATQEVSNFGKALTEINTYANSPEYARLIGNKEFEFSRLRKKSISEMSLEEIIDSIKRINLNDIMTTSFHVLEEVAKELEPVLKKAGAFLEYTIEYVSDNVKRLGQEFGERYLKDSK